MFKRAETVVTAAGVAVMYANKHVQVLATLQLLTTFCLILISYAMLRTMYAHTIARTHLLTHT